jgi:NAD(P)-dependent dehydrogenase (short-subunit alcohol dehydrogenase family)
VWFELAKFWSLTFQIQASYASVQAFADRVNTDLPRLDVLVANAGINASQFTVVEGNESMVTVNVVSLFLLGLLIYPKLRETATKYKTQTHCTTTASDLHEIANFKESQAPPGKIFATLNDESNFNGTERYATSKLLEILIVRQLGKLLPLDRNVIINCVSPG